MPAWWWDEEDEWWWDEDGDAGAPSTALVPPAPSPAETFPSGPLGLRVEFLIGTGWVEVTGKFIAQDGGAAGGEVLQRDIPSIRRGRADETSTVQTSQLNYTVANRDGRWSVRNPASPYWGRFGHNTQVRVSVPTTVALDILDEGPAGVVAPAAAPATAPDAPALRVTGDLDVRVDAEMHDWCLRDLAGKYATVGNQRSWGLQTNADGTVTLVWSPDGTFASRIGATSTCPAPTWPGRRAVRVTLDVDNGASGWTATFYTATSMSGSWVQLGDPVTTAGVTSVFAGTAPLEVGQVSALALTSDGNSDDTAAVRGRIHGFQLRDGIGGTLVANPDFTAQQVGAPYFNDTVAAASNLWAIGAGAALADRRYRFWGEIADLPPRADPSGSDLYVPVTANGILRRLGQGAAAFQSTIYRAITTLTQPALEYWPCEDGSDATVFGSAVSGHQPMTRTGTSTLATFTGYSGSAPLPTVGSGIWTGRVSPYTATGGVQVRFLMAIPAAGTVNGTIICQVSLTGTLARVDLTYTTASGGGITLTGYDSDGTVIFTGATGLGYDGTLKRISIELVQNGADVDTEVGETTAGSSSGSGLLATISGRTVGRASRVRFNATGSDIGDTCIGQVTVHDAVTSILDLTHQLDGYNGEPAGRRVKRLCDEEGIGFVAVGSLGPIDYTADTGGIPRMGPQGFKTLLELLTECAAADAGMLFEPRDAFGVGYRVRTSMYNQDAAVTIDWSAHELSQVPAPVDDDQQVRNDITVSRVNGSSARAVLEVGPLSVQAPPDGVGRYDEPVSLNLASDADLPDQAGMRLALGTVDESRVPQITVARESYELVANAVLSQGVLAAEVGDRLVVGGVPSWLQPADFSQIVQGYTETLGGYTHTLAFNCSPASPYQVGVWDDTGSRYTSDGSELGAAVTASETSLVVTGSGPVWGHGDGDFDVIVGGEQMTVTGVAGAASPQTFTVVRGVNGISKSHVAGGALELAAPAVYAL